MLEFRITEQNTIRIDNSKVVADFTKFIEFKLELPENWQGLTVNGLFYREEDETLGMVENIVSGEVRNLPSAPFKGEEFGQDFKVCVSFIGTGSDGKTATSSVYELNVQPSGLSGMDISPSEDEENPFSAFLRLIEEERKKAEEAAKQSAQSASVAHNSETAAASSAKSAAENAAKTEQNKTAAETAAADAEAAKKSAAGSAGAAKESETAAASSQKSAADNAVKTGQDRTAAETAAKESKSAKDTAVTKADEIVTASELAQRKAAEAEAAKKAAEDIETRVSNTNTNLTEKYNEVKQIGEQVAADKLEIDQTIKDSIISSSEEIISSMQAYLAQANALYGSMYFNADGENPAARAVTLVTIDCGNPASRAVNPGIIFDGGTPLTRILGQ
ncbi:hypothetical protein [Eubacterium sp.]|uniref:hypothetical protein n=1 Tax=Eubacterium sp. TaxID=142586 RepID=UPI0026DEE64D|nr:hypothetical protein [Eubacterium sp.]MDO5433316.1 hypothetical protein [Eubacterium sp.]